MGIATNMKCTIINLLIHLTSHWAYIWSTIYKFSNIVQLQLVCIITQLLIEYEGITVTVD